MKKSIIVIALLFFSGFVYSQTTVTLQDQCNCEVLSGTAVSSPGAVAPGGADTGDIYVNTNTGTIYFWDGDSWELTSTDDQQLTGFTFNGATNELTLTLENGGSVNVDLSSLSDTLTDTNTTITSFAIDGTNTNLVITDSETNTFAVALADIAALIDTDDQTASEVNITDAGGNFTATEVEGALAELAAGSTDDQNIESLGVDVGTNILTVGIEDGTSQTVDLSHLDDAGTDDQNIESLGVDLGTNILTVGIEDGTSQTVDLSHLDDAGTDDQTASEVNITDAGGNFTATEVEGALAELAAGSTDDQNIESLGVDLGTNILTVGIEDGTAQTVDLSHLDDAGTDDQIASEVNITDAGGNFTATEVEGALAELAAGSTDDQNIESLGVDLGTNILTVGIEDGTAQTVDLSHLDDNGTDDQTASEVNITDAGGNFTATEVEGALAELAAGSTDDQNIESLGVDLGTNILTVGIEDGTAQTVDLSHLDDAGTDDQTASEVNITDAGGNFTATEVEGALAELAAGSTDDQNIESLGVDLGTNILTVGIEDGTSQTVDLSHLDDNGTDDQNIESLGVDVGTNILTVGIEDGTAQTVDLSHLDDNGTDDQTASEVNITDAGGNFTATEVEGALAELAAGSTDDQNIESLGVDLGTNILTVGIEDGTAQTVDLSHLDDAGTDDQNIESLGVDLGTNILTVGIEDGTAQTVDLSHLDDAGTDDQTASEVNITDAGGNFTATEVEGALAELAAGSTDDQNIESLGVDLGTNILTVGIEDGTAQTVDLSHLDDAGTDDQNIESLGVDLGTNILTVGIEDGTSQTVDLSHLDDAGTDDQTASEVNITDAGGNFTATEVEGALAELAAGSTDDQNIESLGVDLGTNILTVGIEDGTSQTVDLSHLDDAGTDDQNIESLGVDVGTNILTVGIEDGTAQTVDLSHLDDNGTDDQTASEVNITDAGGNFTATEVEGALAELAAGSTDDQNIESLGVDLGTNILTVGIEDGTSQTVDLSHLDDAGTDDQNIDNLSIVGGELNISLEDDGVAPSTVDLISGNANNDIAAGTDGGLYLNVSSVTISETITTLADNLDGTYTYTSENGTPTTFMGTDDQTAAEVNITDAGGNFTATEVEGALAELAAGSTDDQNIESLGVDLGTNILTVGIEDGTAQTVDLSHLDDAGTDDQTASEVNITDAGGNFTATEVEGALAELAAGSTDDQNIESLGVDLGTNILTVGIEDGTAQTVDLSHLDDAGTDDQNIESLGVDLGTNILTVGIEDGTSQTVDLSHLDDAGTDDQTASEVNITDAGGNFTATEVEGALAELAAGSTDDQNIESLGVDLGTNILTVGIEDGTSQTVDLSHLDDNGTDDQNIESLGVDVGTNILTVGIEDGTAQTVDLSHLDDNGTDDQTASEVNITDAGGNFTATEVEGALAELAAGSTDDQNIESLGVDLGTNILTVGIEDGTAQTVDLSHLDDAGTDDQTASEVNITDAGGNFTATEVEGALAELAAGSTDDQNIESLGVDLGTNILTVGIEDGTAQTVDLSHLDDAGTDDQIASEVNITDAGGNFTATEVEGALAELAAGSTDDQNIESLGVDLGTNILTVGIEDGTAQTVDLSHLDDAGTDDQNIESLGVDLGTNILTVGIEDGTSQTVDLSHLDDAGTDDQNIESLGVDVGTNILTVGIEDGTAQTVDLSHLDDNGTDDQTASEVNITDAGGNFAATEVEGALAELAAGSTDDQNIESLGVDLGTNILTVGIEDGTAQTVDLSHLDDNGTDDQTASEVNITDAGGNFTATEVEGALAELAAGSTDDQNIESLGVDLGTNILTVGIEDGTAQTVDLSHLDDNGTDDQTASEVNITDAGGNFTATEVEGALAELAAGSTDDQNIESLGVDLGTNILTVGIEDGTAQTVDLSHLDDAGTDDQTAAEVNITDAGGNFTATEVEGALAELAAGSTDDQNIESLGVDLGTNILTVGIEDGTAQTVDLSHLDDAGTDDQNIDNLSIVGGELNISLEDDGVAPSTVDLISGNANNDIAAGTDGGLYLNVSSVTISETITTLADNLDGTYTYTSENGTPTTFTGTDDQTAAEVNITDAGGNFTATEVEGALAELAAGSTDDQNIESLGVDLGTNILTVGIEDGTAQTVDLSHLDDAGTDDQTASEVNITDAGGNFTATEVEGALAELAAGSTDDQNIESLGVDLGTNILTVGIEDGTAQTVDLSHLDDAGTDDQNIESLGVDLGTNILTVGIEDGTAQTVDLSHLDDAGTDDQIASEVNITDAGGNFTATEVEGALAELAAGSTDDQNIESLGVDLGTNILTVGIEDGTAQTVDLSHLDDNGTDNQTASEVNITDAGGNFTATEVEGALAELAAGSTDDQNIESLGVDLGTNILTVGIEDGTSQTVDLSHLDDAGTDDQNIESLGVDLGTNILTVGIEDGTAQTVDLSHLDDAGTDDQTASEVNITDAGGNFTATEVEGALTELAAGSTDDQNIESLGVDLGTNILTVGIEDGTGQTVDLSHLDDAGTDDQTAAEVNITDAGGNFTATEVEGALAELAAGSTDDQNIESLGVDLGTNILTVGIEDGTGQTVDLSHLDDAGTDDQTASEVNITDAGGNFTATEVEGALAELAAGSTDDQNIESLGVDLGTNILTVGIEDGTAQTVDLSHLDDNGTDDQTASEVNITDAGGNFTATEVEGALAELAAGSTDDQNIESLGVDLGTNILTVGIEDGTSQTVDLSHLDDAGTDDQNIESLGVDLGTNILTVGIEDGTAQTVDLSHLDDNGTDDQTASEVNITDAGGNFTATEVEGALAELAAGSTDDQNIESLGVDLGTNILTVGIEDGTAQTVDLSHLDDAGTDDQTASEVNITDAGGNFTATEVEGALAELAAQTDDDVSITNTVAGNRIATISETGITAVDINETVTSLSQNTSTGVISYTDEDGGAAETANVVSTDVNNELTVGADGGASFEMTDLDVDGDGASEATVDAAMADIAKVTATAGRIFYPPSIAVDASTTGIKNIDLYQEYLDQFGTPTASSAGAPAAIPTYAASDLYYYVTYADPTVFETDSGDPNFMTIDASGNLTIEVENLPTDYNSLINVVFVVK
ncbi:hypothetical protein [Flagellimonas sp. S3867]|uniref:hypothetical protein n=1 Tax=Flagellimonas sp. S3867 TaxID=2768063 RepID=UPI0016880205|nr:hypothetical protein [Flagellimonas sp. S3867]